MKATRIIIVAVATICHMAAPCSADQEAPNEQRVFTSANGRYRVELTPSHKWRDEGKGEVYALREGKEPASIYSFDWYADFIYLSDDGRSIVRYGPWASDKKSFSDLALGFYWDGVEVRRYAVGDLIVQTNALVHSVSHYTWTASTQSVSNGFSADGKTYTIVMADKTAYDFDLKTGRIAKKYRDALAMNDYEVWEEEDRRHERIGLELMRKSKTLLDFTNLFEVTKVQAKFGYISGTCFSFDKDQWEGSFRPRDPLPFPCSAKLVFTIDANDVVEVGLKPEEVLNALREVCQTPFIAELLRSNPSNKLRLRAAGNRLHWNTDEVKTYHRVLQSQKIAVGAVRDWVKVILDLEEIESKGGFGERLTSGMISLYRPSGGSPFVVDYWLFNNPKWEEQYFRITGEDPEGLRGFPGEKYVAIVDKHGKLTLLPRDAGDE